MDGCAGPAKVFKSNSKVDGWLVGGAFAVAKLGLAHLNECWARWNSRVRLFALLFGALGGGANGYSFDLSVLGRLYRVSTLENIASHIARVLLEFSNHQCTRIVTTDFAKILWWTCLVDHDQEQLRSSYYSRHLLMILRNRPARISVHTLSTWHRFDATYMRRLRY